MVGGEVAGQIFEGIRRFDIYVCLAEPCRSTPEAIGNVLVAEPGKLRIPLSELAEIEEVVSPLSLLVIFLLLFSSFNSLRNCILILLNIPLALVGSIVSLWLSGQSFSVPDSVGFIALFGIAFLNGLVFVTYLNQLYRNGVSVDEASAISTSDEARLLAGARFSCKEQLLGRAVQRVGRW